MITCVRCGAESNSDDYCDQCGASLAPIPPVVPMPSIARALNGAKPRKVIVVPNRIVNVVM